MFQPAIPRSFLLPFSAVVLMASQPAGASTITISGTNAVTIFEQFPATSFPGTLEVNNAPGPQMAESLLFFDLSSLAGNSAASDGVLTLNVTYSDAAMTPTIEVDQLIQPYNPATVRTGNIAGGPGLVPGGNLAASPLDVENPVITTCKPSCVPIPVTLTIPQATLQSWLTGSAANDGIAIRETSFAAANLVQFGNDATFGATLTFSDTEGSGDGSLAPEPRSLTLLAIGIAGLIAGGLRRRR